MPERRMPRPDADFSAYMNHYEGAVDAWWSSQGLNEGELDPLKAAVLAWNAAYAAHVAAAAESARRAKDRARRTLEAAARPVTAFIQSYPKTTDAERAAIGITVREPGPRRIAPPTGRPLVSVEGGQRLTHRLRLADESAPARRARPRGVQRAEVFVALVPAGTPAPDNPEAFRYVGSVSSGSTVLTFEQGKGGLQAYYVARWVASTGGMGPWSDTASATVAA